MQGFAEFNESAEHYNSGFSASKSGKSRQDNPYKEGSLAAKYWAKGYEHHKTGKQPEKFTEEKKIIVKTKMGGEIPATIKVTGKDYHIVKTDSGKQYKVDHQGNSLEEEIDDKDLPFTPDAKKTKPSTPGKYGSAYSTVRNLARKALAKQTAKQQVKEEAEELDERNKENALKRKTMDAARGAMYKIKTGLNVDPESTGHKTPQEFNKALGRALRNEDLEENAPVAPSVGVHRIGVTVSDPGHTAVSKRNEKIQKFVKVTANSKENAVEQGKKFYTKKGWKVHDAEHAGMVHEEVEIEEGYRGNSEADRPYFDAQDHKTAAEKARKEGDHFSYHMNMAAHHDSMAHWSSNKGRHHVADQHMTKAANHEDWAQEARKGSK